MYHDETIIEVVDGLAQLGQAANAYLVAWDITRDRDVPCHIESAIADSLERLANEGLITRQSPGWYRAGRTS